MGVARLSGVKGFTAPEVYWQEQKMCTANLKRGCMVACKQRENSGMGMSPWMLSIAGVEDSPSMAPHLRRSPSCETADCNAGAGNPENTIACAAQNLPTKKG